MIPSGITTDHQHHPILLKSSLSAPQALVALPPTRSPSNASGEFLIDAPLLSRTVSLNGECSRTRRIFQPRQLIRRDCEINLDRCIKIG